MACWWCKDRALRIYQEVQEAMKPMREMPSWDEGLISILREQCRRQNVISSVAFQVVGDPSPENIAKLDRALDLLRKV